MGALCTVVLMALITVCVLGIFGGQTFRKNSLLLGAPSLTFRAR